MSHLRLAEFNSADPDRVRPLLTGCLDVDRWADRLLAGRPYADVGALLAHARITLEPAEIHAAMAAHPRIGEKPAAGTSHAEQSGVDDADAERFRAANVEYEKRFGHVFLVCASGRSGAELLANLRSRLGNDPDTELRIAGEELVEIALLRLEKAVTA
ncbi:MULTISPECIES: 2-oxo-4-hydroxy-4-carboxy-5-ureidoimidazoline decarboxylase [Prauserella salsuginis group]|uniref:2-oxo-4-hydroxy-4-carboxy-5-ureidoimidazoline decarboxylase n=1 Tax=Prauserella salsuginis TaxID=387889 RepID=A0ABW6G6B9_9PSEU|nr:MULTISPECIES: 2-oxo-4-hydroxy-4-carboxy-5-ureidoimidazoline decarboxylase [Prauserella salsuginis group]MCR3719339.1 2-oxo-4-hydroxy-4-carboxy-5-ureidoimidazoline decarboxylase [Prauserella flava]MCR3735647.1 2-oxo-4-hydroxy-4-carboxy-5-ureidoimidazoline decarboxylase [Prauserella salsuginis]